MHRYKKNIHPAEVRRIINALKQADLDTLDKLDPNYLLNKLNTLTISYPHTAPIFPTNWGVFSRAIPYPEIPINKSQLTYPPSKITELGRANRKGEPVFYCSGDPKASFFELGLKPGNTVVLSKWRLNKEIPISLLVTQMKPSANYTPTVKNRLLFQTLLNILMNFTNPIF